MADKRISQLIERTDIANNDVLPIVASGATTTNKVTISTIQDWMQDNLDVGVTSVGITLGTTGTDVNVSGSPITTSGNITINIPDASATARGVVTTGTQTFAGYKIFNGTIGANVDIQLATQGTALNTFIKNINATGQTSIGSNGFGFNNANNIYFSGSSKGGGIIAFSNTGNQTYTLQDASGTLAFTSDLTGYVTLDTAQTITAQKTFSTSGSSDTMIISHGSGSGIALDVIKAGNSEAIRVTKTSGSGNAVTITGGTLSAEAGQFSGDLQTSTRISATSGSNAITITPNVGGTQNRIETTGTLPLALVSADAITMAAGGTTPQITLATTGAVTLTGVLNGTSASFSGDVTSGGASQNLFIANGNTFSGFSLRRGGVNKWAIFNNNAGTDFFDIYNYTTSSSAFTLDSTGAASFSSSVTTLGSVDITGTGNVLTLRKANNAPALTFVGATSDTIIEGGNTFNLYTGGVGSRIFVNASGNVGIGTASPASTLDVNSGTTNIVAALRSTDAGAYLAFADPDTTLDAGFPTSSCGVIGNNFLISTANTERMRITSAGNVGIGTASPKLNGNSGTFLTIQGTSASGWLELATDSTTDGIGGVVSFNNTNIAGSDKRNALIGGVRDGANNSGALIFATWNGGSGAERMRITSGGNVLIGHTATTYSEKALIQYAGGDNQGLHINQTGSTAANDKILFSNGNGIVGYIRTDGSTTSYVSTSDYRLKEDLQEINGLEKVSALRVYDFKWLNSEDRTDGVLAHELAEVLPYAVTGEKDGEQMQGVDYSKIVPVLIKAIQELKAEIDSLKNQIK
jgi:hypothetical protein